MDILGRDNILAEISPVGKAAISAIRFSGKDVKSIAEIIFKTKIKRTRTAYFLRSEIDDIILIYYKAPQSYTGEDVCEIFCHGNPLIVNEIIETALSLKAYKIRLAQPGEFTKRAYLNKKMDLVQAESVAELINSSSSLAVKLGNKALKGELSNKLNDVKNKVIALSGLLELEIDFEEEKAGFFNAKRAIEELKQVLNDVDLMLFSCSQTEIIAKDIVLAIIGDSNVGKSSLFNLLIGKQRSIVHHIPGTTRDYIEARVRLGDFNVMFIDTAGFRTETNSEVELEGISRTHDLSQTALFLVELFESDDYVFKHDRSLKVRNKIDIKKPQKQQEGVAYISAKTGLGIESLKKLIFENITECLKLNEERPYGFILSKRQSELLKRLKESLSTVVHSIDLAENIDAVSYLLRETITIINSLLGKEDTNDETLENVFSKFCIGK
jgi:tRNA modification GTPase